MTIGKRVENKAQKGSEQQAFEEPSKHVLVLAQQQS